MPSFHISFRRRAKARLVPYIRSVSDPALQPLQGKQEFLTQIRISGLRSFPFGIYYQINSIWGCGDGFAKNFPDEAFEPVPDDCRADLARNGNAEAMMPKTIHFAE